MLITRASTTGGILAAFWALSSTAQVSLGAPDPPIRAAAAAQAVADSLVGRWAFDEGTGDAAADSSGYGNDGILLGDAEWVQGWVGGAVQLDGVGARVEIDDAEELDLVTELSLTAWIKPESADDRDGIVTRGTSDIPYSLELTGSLRLRFTANAGTPQGESGGGSWISQTRMGTGGWHHVAVTYDGARVRMYVDGVRDLTSPTPSLTFGVVSEPLVIGANLRDERYFDGVIDDVQIYGSALGDSAIALLAQNVPFTTSTLPIVVIDTEGQLIPDDPKIDCFMGVIDNGPGVLNQLDDPFNGYAGRIGIEIRGSSSQRFPKKQYGFETRDAVGANLNVPLLGMPSEHDWILYAPYTDKSLVRNVLTYDLAREIKDYAARTRYCELVIDGDYRGVYVLIEQLKRDKDRIDITELLPSDTSGDSLTGGYVFKIDREGENDPGGWDSALQPDVHYEFWDPSASQLAVGQKVYLEQYVNSFEAMMDGANAGDPLLGYHAWIDRSSFVTYLLLNELGKNVDGFILSHYLYKDRDSIDPRLVAGPVWDFNLAWGNADYREGWMTEGWQLDIDSGESRPFWWTVFRDDPAGANRLACDWTELRVGVLHTDSLLTHIDALVTELGPAVERNFARWPVLGEDVWPNWFIGATHEEEIDYLQTWITDRLAWMDTQLVSCVSTAWANADTAIVVGVVGDSVTVPISYWMASTAADSVAFVTDEAELTLITDATTLTLSAASSGEFRFRGVAFQGSTVIDVSRWFEYWAVAPAPIAINEINYHSGPVIDPEDWIEFINFGSEPAEVAGWVFQDEQPDHTFVFPPGTIVPPGGLAIACRDTALFRSVFPSAGPILGQFDFGLSNGGELLRLYDAGGTLVDWVPYDDQAPWPIEPDGNGPTLELIAAESDNALASSWNFFVDGMGTPGATNHVVGIADAASVPIPGFHLLLAIPNPFNPRTTLRFSLPTRGPVELDVYDALGRHVARVVEGTLDAGAHEVEWWAQKQASGVYYARLRAAGAETTRSLVLLR